MRLSKTEAARRIGISLTTLDRKIKEGKLRSEHGGLTTFGKPSVHIPIKSIGEYLGITDENELNRRLGIAIDPPVEVPAIAPESPRNDSKALDDPTGFPYPDISEPGALDPKWR